MNFTEAIPPARIRVANPEKAFEQVALKFAPPPIRYEPMIHPSAVIAADVKLGARVSIQPHAVIESGVTIGDDTVVGAGSYIGHGSIIGAGCLIYARATIRERTRIGARVIIHSGVVLGADGFGFEVKEGRQHKIPQIGIVQIDDDVEIGANTTIDRARFGRTWIREGAKIDNLVQIAHNVVVGKHAVIASQAGIAGSSKVGEYVMIGGQAGVTGHIELGDRTIIGAKTGVSKNLPADSGIWWGIPAAPIRKAQERLAWIHRLGQLFDRVKALEKKLEE
jgi:UDP-3-O-[3-hydroxymyristoyl] glucosamine N-acyltransferase